MSLIESVILGLIEGLTEFLPVSSTGHLILASHIGNIAQTDFLKSFEIIIQLGAIASVAVFYWRMLLDVAILKKLAVAFLPTALIGLALYTTIKTYFLENEKIVLTSLFVGGIILIVFELFHKERQDSPSDIWTISYTQSFLIGLFQSIALIPGVSRSAATIIGGLALGLKRTTIVEFSFLLAVPTMLAASGLDFIKNISSFSGTDTSILVAGFASAFLVALLSIKFFLEFIQKYNFIPFGIYRIILAVLFWFFFFREKI